MPRPFPFARFLCLLLLAQLPAVAARDLSQDVPGAADPAGIPRFADAVIIGYRTSQFDQTELPLGPWDDAPEVRYWADVLQVAGRRTRILYLAPPDASALEVIRNYQQALEGLGYEVLFSCSGVRACGAQVGAFYWDDQYGAKFTDSHLLKYVFTNGTVREPQVYVARRPGDAADAYVFVFAAWQRNYAEKAADNRVAVLLEEVLTEPMADRMVLLDAAEIGRGLSAEGRVALYGIEFDFDRASLRPESAPQLAEMAGLLQTQPGLAVFIVGHTDSRGGLDYNMDLSARRAAAVVEALVDEYGIDRARLTPMGVAHLAPLASNASEAGRARNRRVELVER
ncbi:MAG: DUF4892 domain-containing protein [Chromatiaceae bacterium]|nr:MAG: DUF4892 domain-containing protein [Chromatiaceae bacterium]